MLEDPVSQRQQRPKLPEEEEDEFNEGDYDNEERVTKRSLAAAKKQSAKALKKKSKGSDANSETEEESADEEPAARPVAKKRLQRASQAVSKSSGSDSDEVQLSNSDSDGDRTGPESSNHAKNSDPQNPTRPQKASDATKRKEGGKKNMSSDDDDDDENLYDASSRNKDKKSKKATATTNRAVPSRKTDTSRARVEARRAPAKWTAEEDEILKAQFGIYKGSRSIFDVIAMNPDLM